MASPGLSANTRGRGEYVSLAQTDDTTTMLTEKDNDNEARLRASITQHIESSPSTILPNRLSLEGEGPTPEDYESLTRVADKLPWRAYLVAIVEFCERFAYYGLSGPFQNYMANKYNDPNGLPGALGLRQTGATALSNFFQFWCYVTPTIGAIVADQYLGKFQTINYFSLIYMVGILVLFLTSLPISIENGGAFPGLIVSMFIIGLGTGGIKSNVSPLIAEQVRATRPFVKLLRSGRRVIVDPELTVQRIYMMFYMCINFGSIAAIATTSLELHVGFWSAYLLPLIVFCVGYVVLLSGKRRYILHPPERGVIGNCFKILWVAIRNGFDLDYAKPSLLGAESKGYETTWDDAFVDELRTALAACKVFLFFPIYWLTYSQMLNNFVSQAGQMELHGLPNDILPNIDPITIIIFIPILDRLVYPFIRTRLHIALSPVTRITCGFILAASAMAYAAILQARIYSTGPCFTAPSQCDAGRIADGKYKPNEIHVAWQTPAYILVALSEILASTTGLELAYSKAPANMKSFIMSLFLLTSAFGSALGMLLAPAAKDPNLVWLYTGLACTALAGGIAFHYTCKNMGGWDMLRKVEVAEEIEMEVRKAEEDVTGGRAV